MPFCVTYSSPKEGVRFRAKKKTGLKFPVVFQLTVIMAFLGSDRDYGISWLSLVLFLQCIVMIGELIIKSCRNCWFYFIHTKR